MARANSLPANRLRRDHGFFADRLRTLVSWNSAMPSRFSSWAWVLAATLVCHALAVPLDAQPPAVRDASAEAHPAGESPTATAADVEFFEKKVRPLLAARCHQCHGPQKQKGNLRLDSRAAALLGGDTAPAVIPGKPDESLLVDAVRYGDTYQMPPKSQLPPDEVAILVDWVARGAPWGRDPSGSVAGPQPAAAFDLPGRLGHWSFRPVAAVDPPAVADAGWIKTPVDRFILSGLEAAGLQPSPPADHRALIRRVTYDLIGLPPTPAEIDAFLADPSPTAYEKLVDRLLASPHYGERWARHWLDLVRYAETCGHEFDFDMPNAYRYRDYVIRALNVDLPYDQFVVEHVAGDLLPQPRLHPQEGFNESIIATGFFFFGEAKHSPVDVRADEADRIDNQIDVLAKTFLGLTVSCARCHDHKFDPISTKDYYALAGYLQSSRYQQAFIDSPQALVDALGELERMGDRRRHGARALARAAHAPQIKRLAAVLTSGGEETVAEAWSKYLSERALSQVDDVFHPWAVLSQSQGDGAGGDFSERRRALAARLNEELNRGATENVVAFADFTAGSYGAWQTTGAAFGSRPGKPGDWAFVGPPGQDDGRLLAVAAAHSGLVSPRLAGTLRSPTFEITKPRIWYRLHGALGQLRLVVDGLQLIRDPIYGGLQIKSNGHEPQWHAQDVSKWIGHRAYIEAVDEGDGYIALAEVAFSDGPQPAPKPNRLVAALVDAPAVASLEQLAEKYQSLFQQVFTAWLADEDHRLPLDRDRTAIVHAILSRQCFDKPSGPELAAPRAALAELERRQREIEARMAPPRRAMALADGTAENERVFIRGSHKTLGEEVPRRFLEALGGTRHAAPDAGSGRLELARQMVSADNPLLARVIVNRLWHHHFGAGLVGSPDDFGAMGQPPTHPELLDYLAAQLAREGWSLKQVHRLMVLSNTYRMSSQPRPDADRVDPQNKLWHRRTVRRLEAECVRDAILAVSGRLDDTMYGPGVMPYLTAYMTGRGRPPGSGPLDGDGRRSIYLAVRRNFLSPMFLAFDYPTPFTTIGRRSVSNVPAQALTMLNNPLVVEQARGWGARVAADAQRPAVDRVRAMYVTALGRPSDELEERAALAFLSEAAAVGEPEAWAELAHVLFNLKEFVFIP